MAENGFSLPDDGELHIDQVTERAEKYIDEGLWDGLSKLRLRTWQSNFTSPRERYFAARILDSVLYRGPAHTQSLAKHLFIRNIPDVLRAANNEKAVPRVTVELLAGRSDPGVRIVPVIRPTDPPIKSGPIIARELVRALRLNASWMSWPFNVQREIGRGAEVIIFVDDLLGTGGQFKKFITEFKLDRIQGKATVVYAPLVAHEVGRTLLAREYSWIHVACGESLDWSHSAFSKESKIFDDRVNTPETARTFYRRLIRKKDIRPGKKREFGYGRLGLLLAFHNATPNNSLPILWYSGSKFKPLFVR